LFLNTGVAIKLSRLVLPIPIAHMIGSDVLDFSVGMATSPEHFIGLMMSRTILSESINKWCFSCGVRDISSFSQALQPSMVASFLAVEHPGKHFILMFIFLL
jgi:hypothetical protein